MVSTTVLGWSGLVVVLCVTTFGVCWCITLIICLVVFLVGGLMLLYLMHWDATLRYTADLYRRRSQDAQPGISKVVSGMTSAKGPSRLDRRITGAQAVDETLQEVLLLILRDYVTPWYCRLSTDPEFPHEVRRSAQRLAVNFAGRMKEVDWIPYLTTRLVDDAASHLRLFRQARAKTKQQQQYAEGGNNDTPPSKSGGTSPVPPSALGHRRTGSSVSAGTASGGSSTPGGRRSPQPTSPDLEGAFFDLEVTMEGGSLCRDLVCTDPDYERQFLRDLCEVVLFLLLPEEDFACKPVRFLLRELLVSSVLLPLFDLFSDPDYINQTIVWLITREIPLTSEVFLTALRVTDDRDELTATREVVVKEIAQLRSRDSGGEDDTWVKQQLSSLLYLRKVIDARLQRLNDGADSDSAGVPSQLDWGRLGNSGGGTAPGGGRLFSLPLDVVLKNNVALSYFIDYMTSLGAQAYLFFYLNVEGWRVSAEQQISDQELHKMGTGVSVAGASHSTASARVAHQGSADGMREAAYSIFEQYLSEKASPRLRIDESIIRRLLFRIRSETPHETWFDEAQAAVYEKLQTEERFLPGFRATPGYVRLLAELDLLKEGPPGGAVAPVVPDDEDSAESSLSDSASLASFECESTALRDVDTTVAITGGGDAVLATAGEGSSASSVSSAASAASSLADKRLGPSTLTADIIETGIVNDRGKTYGIYAVAVSRRFEISGLVDRWHVYRRYSDFHDLHSKIKDKYGDLAKLTFPGKKTFHNTDRTVLERRMKMLNDYLQIVLQPGVLANHPQLPDIMAVFLEQGSYGAPTTAAATPLTLDSLVKSSMRSVGQAVRTVPDNLLSTVDGVVDGLSRVFGVTPAQSVKPGNASSEATKVGASIDTETADNIPLRIMLLLMDEVFDLKQRNQWLRRRIVTLLRQIVRTMFGDIVNRRILDYVLLMTSPDQVADYLRALKHSLWPNGSRAEARPSRDDATRSRTRVAAKVALLSSMSDELKHIIGSETARRGLLRVVELFQRPVLNRRLLHVLLEGVLTTLFPNSNLHQVFRRLHSRSPRVPSAAPDLGLRAEAVAGRTR